MITFVVGDGSGNHSTTSSTFADIDAQYSVDVPASAGDELELAFSTQWFHTSNGATFQIRFLVDGTAVASQPTDGLSSSCQINGAPAFVVFTWKHVVDASEITAGEVSVSVQFATSSSTLTIRNDDTFGNPVLSVINHGLTDPPEIELAQTAPGTSQALAVAAAGEIALAQTTPGTVQALAVVPEAPVEIELAQTTPGTSQALVTPLVITGTTITLTATVKAGAIGQATPHVDYPNPADEPGWSGKVVDMFGTLVAELPDISVQRVTYELNRPHTARVVLPKGTAPALKNKELQLWRNEQIMFWGPVTGISAQADQGPLPLNLADVSWFFWQLVFGTAERTNRLTNGGMEGSLDPWAAVNITADHATTGAVLRGDGVAVLYGRTDPNAYITQTQSYETTWPFGQRLTVSAWCHISEGDWSGPAVVDVTDDLGSRTVNPGLMVIRRTYPGGEIQRVAVAEINSETPRGKWVRLETSYNVAPDEVGTIEVRLYGVDGTIRWDEARATVFESTSGDPDGNDQAELIRRIFSYAQTGRGKVSLNVGTNTPDTGVTKPLRAWQHADHQPIMSAVNEFVEVRDGVDVSVEITPVSRTATTHYPFKGTDRSASLTLSTATNCVGFSYDWNRGRGKSEIIILGPASGPSREEGSATDLDAFGGIVQTDVIPAPPDLPIGQLDEYAAEELRVRSRPESFEALIHDRDLIGVLEVGDLVTVDFDDGFVEADGVWRIVRLVLDAPADRMMATLNWWSV